jgi:hypothetical protein
MTFALAHSGSQPDSFDHSDQYHHLAQVVGIEPTREDFGDPTATLAATCVIVVSLGDDPSPHPFQGCASTNG